MFIFWQTCRCPVIPLHQYPVQYEDISYRIVFSTNIWKFLTLRITYRTKLFYFHRVGSWKISSTFIMNLSISISRSNPGLSIMLLHRIFMWILKDFTLPSIGRLKENIVLPIFFSWAAPNASICFILDHEGHSAKASLTPNGKSPLNRTTKSYIPLGFGTQHSC